MVKNKFHNCPMLVWCKWSSIDCSGELLNTRYKKVKVEHYLLFLCSPTKIWQVFLRYKRICFHFHSVFPLTQLSKNIFVMFSKNNISALSNPFTTHHMWRIPHKCEEWHFFRCSSFWLKTQISLKKITAYFTLFCCLIICTNCQIHLSNVTNIKHCRILL